MAKIRIRITATGLPLITCFMQIGGVEVEEILDGVGHAELSCLAEGSIVKLGLLAKDVDLIKEWLPAHAEDAKSEQHVHPAAH